MCSFTGVLMMKQQLAIIVQKKSTKSCHDARRLVAARSKKSDFLYMANTMMHFFVM